MSDTISMSLEALTERERSLELDAVAIKARIEEIRELRNMLEHPRKPRSRPRRDPAIIEMPTRVTGAVAVAEPEPPEAA